MSGDKLAFLLKEIDRGLWAKVKRFVFREQITIRVFILEAIKLRLDGDKEQRK